MLNTLESIKSVLWALTMLLAIVMLGTWLYTLISREPYIKRIRYGAFLTAAFCVMAVGFETPFTLPDPLFAASLSVGAVGMIVFAIGLFRILHAIYADTHGRSAPPH